MSFNSESAKNIIRLGTALVILFLILNFSQIKEKTAYLDAESVEVGQSSIQTGPGIGAIIPASCPSYEHTPGECTPPTADVKANGSDGPLSIEYNKSVTISWSSTNATECVVSPAAWTGTSGSQSVGPFDSAGNLFVSLTCFGPGGSAADSVLITIFYPAPIIAPNPSGGGSGGSSGSGSGGGESEVTGNREVTGIT